MLWKFLMPLLIAAAGSAAVTILVVAKPAPIFEDPPQLQRAIPVSVAAVKSEQLVIPVLAQGTVYPRRQIDLVAQVAGQITEISPSFRVGGFFAEGRSLLQIDPRDYQVAVLEAQARLAEAERRLAEEQGLTLQAQRQWQELGNRQANDLFMRKPQLAAAQAAVDYAQAQLSRAQLDLSRTQITLPFAGRVKSLTADLGQFVGSGTVIAQVYDSSVFEVRVPLTEEQAALIDLPLIGETAPSPVSVKGAVAGTPMQWQGQLVRADAFVDPHTRMYHAVVEINAAELGPEQSIIPGIFVELEIQSKALSNVIKLPRPALYQGSKLIVVGDHGQAKIRSAQLLKKDAEFVWLQSPVPDGELVVLEKHALLSDGTPLDPLLLSAEALASITRYR